MSDKDKPSVTLLSAGPRYLHYINEPDVMAAIKLFASNFKDTYPVFRTTRVGDKGWLFSW